MRKDTLDIIIPIYNEQECIPMLMKRLFSLRKKIHSKADVNFMFINDGSKDKSLMLLSKYADKNNFVKIINFSRNFGHQLAVTAGIDYADADYVVIIDADLQDPPEVVYDMYMKAKEGYDIVYGQRIKRKGETVFKKATATLFYRFINKMCDIEIPLDTGDFRLISRKVVNTLRSMREKHRFIRGMVPWSGFKSYPFRYHRDERFAGETKYPLKKMIRLAKDAIFSFSDKPLKVATYFGSVVIVLGSLSLLFLLYLRFFTTYYVSGITAVIALLMILSGVQIMIMGVMGEYIGRIFEESKRRPLYIVDDVQNLKNSGYYDLDKQYR
ncbi:MAG: glycosyltransferase family 2 protein [Candidatus Woesearchaeota archaeon]